MYCKKIEYEDYDGNKRSEDFYFNLTEAEIIEWLSTNAEYTLDKVIENMRKKMDVKGLMEATKDLIYRSYGEKSLDGRRFIKTPEVKAAFMETNAYSALFMELCTSAEAAAEFFNNIIPKDLGDSVRKIMDSHPGASIEEMKMIAYDESVKPSITKIHDVTK